MKKIQGLAAVALATALLVGCTIQGGHETKVEALLARMTLAEKLGQLQQLVPSGGNITGPDGGVLDTEELIRAGLCGSILSEQDQEKLLHYQKIAVDSTRLGIPLIFGYDFIHGARTTFPENLALSCSWNPELVERTAAVAAQEAAAFGYHWTFSPMCDVAIDPRWGRVSEGSGEDPWLSGQLSAAMVRGYQGKDLSSPETILACVKHFAAYGAAEAGRDYNTVDMSELMFRDRHLPSYKAAIDAGALSVMSSFNDFMGVPASGNKWLLTDLLRDELGFNGFVVSDYNAVTEMCAHGVAADWKDAAGKALNAGLNMDMVDGAFVIHGEQLVKEGIVSEKTIDRLCREVLLVKQELGLFDDPFQYGSKDKWENDVYRPESIQTAREAARESMVLLKNEGVLPFKGTERIALIGPAGASKSYTTGAWSGMAEPEKAVSFLEGLQERFGSVRYEQGSSDFEAIEGGIQRAQKLARQSDVVLMALGLPSDYGGEAASLASIDIPEAQRELFDAVAATGKPIVLLLSTGRPMTIAEETERSAALLVTWHAGIQAGNALADILSGDFNPTGRLTITFPYSLGQVPIHYNHKVTGRPNPGPQATGRYFSRYMDVPNEPLFTFGEGLSYTTFAYSEIEIPEPEIRMGEDVKVRVKVTNTGSVAGTETVQLYLHDLVASTTRPVRELKGFERVTLSPGESRTVEFTITPELRSFCRADMSTGEEPGDFEVFAGHDSRAALSTRFTVR